MRNDERGISARMVSVLLAIAWLTAAVLLAQSPARRTAELGDLSIEELMNIEVTSVAKKEQRLGRIAASVYVLTQEDIRRSGRNSLPEVLRLVPGVQVARMDNHSWAIGIRGFNDEFSNKLLVLVDGRSVYKNLYSGVYWNAQEVLIENVERIEVIRGPGGTIWGANAVNGVINIITRSAEQTTGGLVIAAVGSDGKGLVGTRFGDRMDWPGKSTPGFYRIDSRFIDRGPFPAEGRRKLGGDSITGSAGLRMDWKPSERDSAMVDGGYVRGSSGLEIVDRSQLLPGITRRGTEEYWGAHALGRWKRQLSEQSSLQLQMYYDGYGRTDLELPFTQHAIDLEFQHSTILGRHEVIWGGEYRFALNSSRATALTRLVSTPNQQLRSGFVQDQFAIQPDRLYLIGGVRVDSATFAPVETQPTVRLLYTPNDKTAWWAALSRAARTPSLFERGVEASIGGQPGPGGLSIYPVLNGTEQVRPEILVAYEAGQRLQIQRRVSVDLSLYVQRYSNLATIEGGAPVFKPGLPPRLILPLTYTNHSHGDAYGGDLAVRWTAAERWKVAAGYSLLEFKVRADPGFVDFTPGYAEGRSPRHQAQVSSYLDLPHRLQLDGFVSYTGRLAKVSYLQIPSYWGASLRLGWRPTENLEFSLGGDNLGGAHAEFGSARLPVGLLVRRSVSGKLTWRF
jgi:iron complex outermembrane recepter protein